MMLIIQKGGVSWRHPLFLVRPARTVSFIPGKSRGLNRELQPVPRDFRNK